MWTVHNVNTSEWRENCEATGSVRPRHWLAICVSESSPTSPLRLVQPKELVACVVRSPYDDLFLAGLCSMLLLLKSFPSMYSSVTHVFCEQAESFRRIYFTPLVKLLHLQLLHVRRLPEATPAHSALRLAVDARTGGKPDIRPEWKRQQLRTTLPNVGAADRGRHWAEHQRRLEDRT